MLSFPLPLPIVLLLMGGVMQLPHERVHSGAFSWHILLQVSQWPLPLLWLTLRVEQLPPHFFGILKINELVIQWRFMANTFGVNWAKKKKCEYTWPWKNCLYLCFLYMVGIFFYTLLKALVKTVFVFMLYIVIYITGSCFQEQLYLNPEHYNT